MEGPTIICPRCGTEIKLTESLAAPLIEETRLKYEGLLARKDEDISERESTLREREEAVSKEKASLDSQLAEKLRQELPKVAAEEARKAKQLLETDLSQKDQEIVTLQEIVKRSTAKLGESQRAQTELLRKQQELEEEKQAMELTIATRVGEELALVREKARKDADDQLGLKLSEKDEVIGALQKTINELKRQAEQGSQQLQGEVQELSLEKQLRERFPLDSIEPVKKGEPGADVLQRVAGPAGQPCGTILWESKRTKNWGKDWLAKLRQDQREAGADVALLISQALPKDVETFDLIDGVCVAHPRVAIPIATLLRQWLIEVASMRHASEGQETKTQLVYQYLTGPRFRQRVEAIVEAFSSMQGDLVDEKRAINKQWAKREMQLDNVVGATAGMYGDLQGIAGKTLQEIEGLSLPALGDGVPECEKGPE